MKYAPNARPQKSPDRLAPVRGFKLKISQRKITTVSGLLPNTAGARVFHYLAEAGRACTTAELASHCACGNVSAAVSSIHDLLQEHGLLIVNCLPSPPIKNRFGGTSMMHLWQLVEAAE